MSNRSTDNLPTETVGFVVVDELSDEQRLAIDVAASAWSSDIDVVYADELRDGVVNRYDCLWWHRDTPLLDSPPQPLTDVLGSYAASGGNLLLTLYALTAIDDLGIDPQPPDRTVDQYEPTHAWEHRPSGFLVHPSASRRPPFDGWDRLRIYTQPSNDETVPRIGYDRCIPRHGVVLASTVVDGEDRPEQNSVVAWEHGTGRVLGVGRDVSFQQGVPEFETELTTLLEGIERFFVDENGFGRRPYAATALSEIRERGEPDHNRPEYHVTPPENWLNDPNGVVKWDDEYHLFYQYNPAGPYHGTIHWGHVVSDDLVHWEDRPVALTPGREGPDRHGCWSGCTVVDDGQPTFVYTGADGRKQRPCLARAVDDELDRWVAHDDNPIIDTPPTEEAIVATDEWEADFRDHDVWQVAGDWYQLIGSGLVDRGGTAFLYRSEDLLEWSYEGKLLVGDRDETGDIWECPELLEFGDAHVFQVSNYDKVIAFRGTFDGERFHPDERFTVDHGNYYAAQSVRDGDRYLSWGWIREDRDESAQWEAGWSGVMSVPRSVTLGDTGALQIKPAPELATLRSDHASVHNVSLSPADPDPLEDVQGAQLEFDVEFELGTADAFEIVLRETSDGCERTPIRYDSSGSLTVDRRESTQSTAVATEPQTIPSIPETDSDRVRLRIFLDASVIETFVNDRTSLSSRIYPTRPDSVGVSCNAHGGTVRVHSLDVWSLSSAF